MTVAAVPSWYCRQPFFWRHSADRIQRLGGTIGLRQRKLGAFGAAYRWSQDGNSYVPINFVTDFHPSHQTTSLSSDEEKSLDDLLQLASTLPTLEKIDLTGMPLVDENLRHLQKLRNVKYLSLYKCPVGDAAMKYVSRMPALETLSLQRTLVTDEGIAELVRLKNLKHLALRETQITEAAVSKIHAIPSIKRVELPPALMSFWEEATVKVKTHRPPHGELAREE